MLNQRWNDIIDEAGNYIGYTGYVDGVLSETGEYVTKEDGSVVFCRRCIRWRKATAAP